MCKLVFLAIISIVFGLLLLFLSFIVSESNVFSFQHFLIGLGMVSLIVGITVLVSFTIIV